MSAYRLSVSIESHNAQGEFYLVGKGYETAGGVLEYVAADHILRISNYKYIESYLLEVLSEGENVSEDTYEATDADISCGVHADVSYQKFSFWAGDDMREIGREPTESDLKSLADDFR